MSIFSTSFKTPLARPLPESWPERMSKNELWAFIDGCHRAREYDSYFEAACREWNERYRGGEL